MRIGKLRRPLVGLAVLAIAAGGVYYHYHKQKAAEREVTYRTAPVERRDVTKTVLAVGVVEPLTTVEVKANVAGEIVQLAVDRGDEVAAGDLIARIDPTETRTTYDKAKADLDSALGKVREVSAELRRQRTVVPAQVAASTDAIQTAEAKVRQAQSALSYQRRSTEAQIERYREALVAAKARLEQAKARAEAQPELTAASVKQAQAELQSATQSLTRLQQATHPQERATLKSALEAARVALERDKRSLDRQRQLNEGGFVAKQEVENSEKQLADTQDRYDSAKASYDALGAKQSTELKEAEARVEQAAAALKAAQLGDVDVRVAQRELEAAEADVRQAQANLDGAVAGRDQDQQRLQELEAARASTKESRSQLRVTRAGEIQPEVTAQQLAQAEAAALKARAEVENAQKNLGYTTIVAPRGGLVLDKYVEQGTVVSSSRSAVGEGPTLVTIADVSRMFVLAEVDETDIEGVALGQPAEVEVDALPDATFPGTVTQVYPKGTEVENVTIFHVRIEVTDGLDRLKPEMTAEASIIVAQAKNVLAVPSDAVFEQQGKSFARVLKDGQPQPTPVRAGLVSTEWAVIEWGLSEGQQVVLGGAAAKASGGQEGPPGGGPPGGMPPGGMPPGMRR